MPIECRIIEPGDWSKWDEFVSLSQQGTLFHTSLYKQAVDASYGAGELVLVGAFEGESLIAGCVALERIRMRQNTAVTPLLTPYVGYLLRDDTQGDGQTLATLGQWMCARYHYQLLINSPQLNDISSLQQIGYAATHRFTYVLSLDPTLETKWQLLEGQVRRNIKKAEKAGFGFGDQLDADDALRLFVHTFHKRGEKCPVPKSFFHEVAFGDHLRAHRIIVSATVDGQLASYIVALHYNKTAYYSIAATSHDHLQSGISSLMIWRLYGLLRERGFEALDLVGANIPSIARFKEGFKPELRSNWQLEQYRGIHVKLGKKLAQFRRK